MLFYELQNIPVSYQMGPDAEKTIITMDLYSKTRVKRPLKNRQNKDLNDNL